MDLGKKGGSAIRIEYLILGMALIVIGILAGVLITDLYPIPMLIAIGIISLGLILIYVAFYSDMDSYYRYKSGCALAPGNTYCNHKCTQCIFALEYIRQINKKE